MLFPTRELLDLEYTTQVNHCRRQTSLCKRVEGYTKGLEMVQRVIGEK